MKNKVLMLCVLVMCVYMSGCASSGRFCLVDIDLRTPEQISAYIKESEAVYIGETLPIETDPPEITTKSGGVLSSLFSFLQVLKCRVRVFSAEWRK